jgi:hypothetical protein
VSAGKLTLILFRQLSSRICTLCCLVFSKQQLHGAVLLADSAGVPPVRSKQLLRSTERRASAATRLDTTRSARFTAPVCCSACCAASSSASPALSARCKSAQPAVAWLSSSLRAVAQPLLGAAGGQHDIELVCYLPR